MHEAEALLKGNGTAAVRSITPDYAAPHIRAHSIMSKSKDMNVGEYIDNQLQQIGSDAIDRVGELVLSEDERIATKNAHYIIDHIRGKAVQRNISLTGKLNIQSVLD
jgi:hypothetical protein